MMLAPGVSHVLGASCHHLLQRQSCIIMDLSNSAPLTSPVLLAGVLAAFVLLLISSCRYRPPPGPPGNVAAEFTKSPMPVLFDKWRKQYGTSQTSSARSKRDLNLIRSYILFQGWEKACNRYGNQASVLLDGLKTP